MPKYNLRGEVIKRWKKAGRPQWDYKTTEKICLEVDHYLAELGQNPTPRFREEVKKKNKSYFEAGI